MGLWKPANGCCLGGLWALKKGGEEMMTRGGLGYGQFSDRPGWRIQPSGGKEPLGSYLGDRHSEGCGVVGV